MVTERKLIQMAKRQLSSLSCITGVLMAWLLISLTPQTAEAQFDDCPQFHVCLIGCTNDVLVGGSQQQFNSCTDQCNNIAQRTRIRTLAL